MYTTYSHTVNIYENILECYSCKNNVGYGSSLCVRVFFKPGIHLRQPWFKHGCLQDYVFGVTFYSIQAVCTQTGKVYYWEHDCDHDC